MKVDFVSMLGMLYVLQKGAIRKSQERVVL